MKMLITFGIEMNVMEMLNISSLQHGIPQYMIAPNLSQMVGFNERKNIKRRNEVP